MIFHNRPKQTERIPIKLSSSVTLMLCAVISAVLLAVYTLNFIQISTLTRSSVQDTALAVARTLASSPTVIDGLKAPPKQSPIAKLAENVQIRNDLLFVVVTDMAGIRYSHPTARNIGNRFIGNDIEATLRGQENTSVSQGTLVEALRVFTPVYDNTHRQIGVVAVGISLREVNEQLNESRWNMLWAVLFSLLVGTIGSMLLVQTLKRILFGLEPYEISTLFEQRQAMLQSLKEGIIAVDKQGTVTLMNLSAQKMFHSSVEPALGKHKPPEQMVAVLHEVLHSGTAIQDREIFCFDRQLLCNAVPIYTKNKTTGAICTFRDKTEINQLTQRVNGMVSYVDALRERSHEFMNKLHVILGLLQLKHYDKLENYILQTANNYQMEIGSLQSKIQSPVIAGFLIGKISRVQETGQELILAEASFLPDNTNEQQITVLITTLGNLIENALDALGQQKDGEIEIFLHYLNGILNIEVSDNGPGIEQKDISSIFDKGYTTKGEQRGVGLFLVKHQIENCQGNIHVESEPGVLTRFFIQIPWNSERNSM